MKYQLLNKRGIPTCIMIDESAKQDFKELMNWNEKKFKRGTIILREGKEKEITLL